MWSVLGSALLLIVVGLFVYRYVYPSTAGHVFGPIGKGLIASDNPAFSVPQRLALIGYRAWYVTLTLILTLATTYCLPGYLRATFSAPVPHTLDPEDTRTIAAAIQAMAIPAVGVSFLLLLFASTHWIGVGEMAGDAGTVAMIAMCVMLAWLILAMIRLGRVQVDHTGHFMWVARLVIRLKALRVIVLTLGVGMILSWLSTLRTSSDPRPLPPAVEAEVFNKGAEYFDWHLDRIRTLVARIQMDVNQIVIPRIDQPARRRAFCEEVGLPDKCVSTSSEDLHNYLVHQTVVRTLLLHLAQEHLRDPPRQPVALTEDQALKADRDSLRAMLGGTTASISRKGGSLFYSKGWLTRFRPRAVDELLDKFTVPLIGLGGSDVIDNMTRTRMVDIARSNCVFLAAAGWL